MLRSGCPAMDAEFLCLSFCFCFFSLALSFTLRERDPLENGSSETWLVRVTQDVIGRDGSKSRKRPPGVYPRPFFHNNTHSGPALITSRVSVFFFCFFFCSFLDTLSCTPTITNRKIFSFAKKERVIPNERNKKREREGTQTDRESQQLKKDTSRRTRHPIEQRAITVGYDAVVIETRRNLR